MLYYIQARWCPRRISIFWIIERKVYISWKSSTLRSAQLIALGRKKIHSPEYPLNGVTERQWPNTNIIIKDETKEDPIRSKDQMEKCSFQNGTLSPWKPRVSSLGPKKLLALKSWLASHMSASVTLCVASWDAHFCSLGKNMNSSWAAGLSEDNILFISAASPPRVAVV